MSDTTKTPRAHADLAIKFYSDSKMKCWYWSEKSMTDRKLPDDVARCDGRITANPTGFGTISVGQVECLRCLRRTSERGEHVWMMEPPQFVDGKCPMRMGGDK